MRNIITDNGQLSIDGYPNNCPFCHKSITPNVLQGHLRTVVLEVLLYCPDEECRKGFLGYYEYDSYYQCWVFNGQVTQGNIIGRDFSETIIEISDSFVTIYNQAYAAEQQNLTEICGVGYRKALEFLIKDYAILKVPTEKEKIEKKLLGTCISDYVDDTRIKSVAKRAAWLGNDETHYIRKWEGKNLEDLKKLIDLTVHWIEMETLTKSFETEMPE